MQATVVAVSVTATNSLTKPANRKRPMRRSPILGHNKLRDRLIEWVDTCSDDALLASQIADVLDEEPEQVSVPASRPASQQAGGYFTPIDTVIASLEQCSSMKSASQLRDVALECATILKGQNNTHVTN